MEIKKEMTIATILQLVPNADNIMFAFGLHCIGCHGSTFESLNDGASAHGLSEEEINKMVKEINDHYQNYQTNLEKDKFSITKSAYQAMLSQCKKDDKIVGGMKITVEEGFAGHNLYQIEAVSEKPAGYEEINYQEIKLFLDKKEIPLFWGTEIDYVADDFRQGFTLNKPQPLSS